MKRRIAVICFVIIGIICYNRFVKADAQSFSTVLDKGTYASPYANYEIIMRLYLPSIDSSFGFAEGTLLKNGNTSKVIYWNKVNATTDEWMDVKWIDIDTVMIDNVEFDISMFPDVDIYYYRAN